MKIVEPSIESIFNINSDKDFEQCALKIFNYQAQQNEVYKEFISLIGVNPMNVKSIDQIPFLPISFFKSHSVTTTENHEKVFKSSGTTKQVRSRHLVYSTDLYIDSFVRGFNSFYGDFNQYCFLALLPSYIEQGDSSLVYMTDYFVEKTKANGSAFFLNEFEKLKNQILSLEQAKKPYILLGVSYALLDFIDEYQFKLNHAIIMETGGMKGKRKELTKNELHKKLKEGFGIKSVHSEYGMTELLSQAYSKGGGIYSCPPWVKVVTRSTNDPFQIVPDSSRGLISIMDLANIHSCSFIATDDLGIVNEDGSFSILGRFDKSEIRGCNLLVGE